MTPSKIPYKAACVFCAVFFCLLFSASGQSVRDSILKLAYAPATPPAVKVKAFAKLSVLFPAKGLAFASLALNTARQSKNDADIAYAYSYLATAYLPADSFSQVKNCVDSALKYAKKSGNKLVQGIALYRKGWLANINNQVDEAFADWEKALDLLGDSKEGAAYRSGIYYLYFGIYAERGDVDKEALVAGEALAEAQKSGEHDILSPAWQINGTAYLDRFDITKDSALLDSSLYAFKNSVGIYEQYKDELAHKNIPALSALYVAQIYMDHYSPEYEDSTIRYTKIALQTMDSATANNTMLINCFTILSKYSLQDGRTEDAENLLLRSEKLFDEMQPKDYYVGQNLYFELAELYEKKGETQRAFDYYKQYIGYYKKEFDARQFETAKRLEARYQTEKKEKEIGMLKAKEAFRKKENYFYLGIAAVSFIGLVFMFRAYHFRLKYSLQREKALQQEKEEADLQSKLKSEEAARMQLEKQEAELHAKLREEEAARLQAEQQLLKSQQEQLQKEIMTGALQIEHKNELLQTLKEKLSTQQDITARQLGKILHEESRLDEDFEKVKSEFKDIHPGFFNRLQEKAGQKLTGLDLKYCAYIYLKLSSKQIASLLHVEPKSVRMARYRLKQKLGLSKEDSLDEYLNDMKD